MTPGRRAPAASGPTDPLTWPERRVQRFRAFIDQRGARECWPWQGKRMPNGLGKYGFRQDRQRFEVSAARALYILERGRLKRGHEVFHMCPNLWCVNWRRHLKAGTAAERMAAVKLHGRTHRGERHHGAKLTAGQARRILALKTRRNRPTAQAVAERFGLASASWVAAIWRGDGWRHLERPRQESARLR